MHLIDTSALIVAVNVRDDRHEATRARLEGLLNGGGSVLIASATIVSFVRQITRFAAGLPGLSVGDAFQVIEVLLARSNVRLPLPDARHFSRVRELLEVARASGKHVDDAHLAALAIQYGATIVTYDSDFARFPDIKWESPAA